MTSCSSRFSLARIHRALAFPCCPPRTQIPAEGVRALLARPTQRHHQIPDPSVWRQCPRQKCARRKVQRVPRQIRDEPIAMPRLWPQAGPRCRNGHLLLFRASAIGGEYRPRTEQLAVPRLLEPPSPAQRVHPPVIRRWEVSSHLLGKAEYAKGKHVRRVYSVGIDFPSICWDSMV
jgi:hypothetical protein